MRCLYCAIFAPLNIISLSLSTPTRSASSNTPSFPALPSGAVLRDELSSRYGKVILPFTLLRRLDQVLEPTKGAVLETSGRDIPEAMRDHLLKEAAGSMVYNTSRFIFEKLICAPRISL